MTETVRQAARRLAAGAIRQGFKPQALHEYTGPDGKPSHWLIRLKNYATLPCAKLNPRPTRKRSRLRACAISDATGAFPRGAIE
jgi:hypothetical protein